MWVVARCDCGGCGGPGCAGRAYICRSCMFWANARCLGGSGCGSGGALRCANARGSACYDTELLGSFAQVAVVAPSASSIDMASRGRGRTRGQHGAGTANGDPDAPSTERESVGAASGSDEQDPDSGALVRRAAGKRLRGAKEEREVVHVEPDDVGANGHSPGQAPAHVHAGHGQAGHGQAHAGKRKGSDAAVASHGKREKHELPRSPAGAAGMDEEREAAAEPEPEVEAKEPGAAGRAAAEGAAPPAARASAERSGIAALGNGPSQICAARKSRTDDRKVAARWGTISRSDSSASAKR